MKGFPLGTHVAITTKEGDIYNNVTGVIVSKPFDENSCMGYFIGCQRVMFDYMVHSGERYISQDIIRPQDMREI